MLLLPIIFSGYHETHSLSLARSRLRESRLSWQGHSVPETKLILHAPGWTVFDCLYMLNGTFYVVTNRPDVLPQAKFIISTGIDIANGEEAAVARLPTERVIRVISPAEARSLFGTGANRIHGVTWLANDPSQFVRHYFHGSAELLLGFWRTHSALDPLIPIDGTTRLSPPRRLIFTHIDALHWRDYYMKNPYVLRTAFPSLVLEFSLDWNDRAAAGVPFVFDRVIIADRSAAMLGNGFMTSYRTASEPQALPGSPYWWNSFRNNVVRSSGLDDKAEGSKPVITYIVREWRRRLRQEDHEHLVEELKRLETEHGYEVNIVKTLNMAPAEEVRLLGRSTIALGVHGNGMTSLIWMDRTPQATVLEFFYPGGFAYDYEYTARALGISHVSFWGNITFSYPDLPPVAYPIGFQGNSIPVDATLVAKMIYD
ncbi:hypothetical protein PENSPDRAFT_644559 [Peniophora sp. CONT]|nr:hypothetical protein PENSPDRAFT_644559 [Peniophora sp. CONT]